MNRRGFLGCIAAKMFGTPSKGPDHILSKRES